MVRALAVFALLGACTSEKEQAGLLDLHVVGTTCPRGADAKLELARTDVGAVDLDGEQCGVEQLLTVSDPVPPPQGVPDGPSCCFAVQCDPPADPVTSVAVFDAACVAAGCDAVDLTTFTRARVQDALAATVPQCTLEPSATGPDETTPTLTCWYTGVTRYVCGGLGG